MIAITNILIVDVHFSRFSFQNNPPASASGGAAAKAKGFSASQLSTAQKHKDEGNAKFKTGNHWDAMQCYKAAIDTLHDKNRNSEYYCWYFVWREG